ncbi:MAG TPA: FHA domain-containing protein [Pyrinomonadaceae bacterium]|nr:FHA domain-containing protein [Pyrinomonadaceae bacterium]
MLEVTLRIQSAEDTREVALAGDRMTLGRGDAASIVIKDKGLSRIHASINRNEDSVWVLDEGSTNGTCVNGEKVSARGTPLSDGDEITLGNDTLISVSFGSGAASDELSEEFEDEAALEDEAAEETEYAGGGNVPGHGAAVDQSSRLPIVAAAVAIAVVLIAAVALVAYALRNRADNSNTAHRQSRNDPGVNGVAGRTDNSAATNESTVNQSIATASPAASTTAAIPPPIEDATSDPVAAQHAQGARQKLYLQMTEQEKMDFIEQRARHISMMMGNRPYAFNDDVLKYIKQYLDGYAHRVGNGSTKLWGEDMRSMFERAHTLYAPYITRAFNSRGVPPVVGLYLVVVETEYHNIHSENAAGAAGLFQFIGPTARGYGVDPSERTNVAKMAPAAAAYLSDRIAEFGPDSMSVALAIAGYNRSPDSVRRDLHDVLNSDNRERSFWTLVANSSKLDHYFQGENIKYVPKFFAAAIVGETPWAFGLQMQPLSTYTEITAPPDTSSM